MKRLLLLGLFAVAQLNAMELDAKNTIRLQAKEKSHDGVTSLEVSGISGHSAYVVKDTRLVKKEGTIEVHVELEASSVMSPSKSGSFSVMIPSLEGVQRVTFGPTGKEVWAVKPSS